MRRTEGVDATITLGTIQEDILIEVAACFDYASCLQFSAISQKFLQVFRDQIAQNNSCNFQQGHIKLLNYMLKYPLNYISYDPFSTWRKERLLQRSLLPIGLHLEFMHYFACRTELSEADFDFLYSISESYEFQTKAMTIVYTSLYNNAQDQKEREQLIADLCAQLIMDDSPFQEIEITAITIGQLAAQLSQTQKAFFCQGLLFLIQIDDADLRVILLQELQAILPDLSMQQRLACGPVLLELIGTYDQKKHCLVEDADADYGDLVAVPYYSGNVVRKQAAVTLKQLLPLLQVAQQKNYVLKLQQLVNDAYDPNTSAAAALVLKS